MRKISNVKDFMTVSPHTIGVDQSIAIALERMNDLGVRHLPVLKGGKLAGLLSDRDIRLVEALEHVDPKSILVQDVMAPDVYIVTPETSLDEVVTEMAEQKYGSVVVMDKDKIIGIFTVIDALRVLAHELRKT